MESAFYFIFKSQEDAERAREELVSGSHAVDLLPEEGSDSWLVLRIQNMSEDEYFAADDRMEKLAASLGGVYDGAQREVEGGRKIDLPIGSLAKDTLYYQCFFCGGAIAEEDPERRDVFFTRPDAKEPTAGIYACHSTCATKAAHTSVFLCGSGTGLGVSGASR